MSPGPRILEAGVPIGDNSSAFRSAAPLVIPEINPEAITPDIKLVASPNCITTIALTGLAPILLRHAVQEMEVVSYQAASGAGQYAMAALLEAAKDLDWSRQIQSLGLDRAVAPA